jgi:hypothetical protein
VTFEEEVAKIMLIVLLRAPVPAMAKMPATKKCKSTAVQSEGAAVQSESVPKKRPGRLQGPRIRRLPPNHQVNPHDLHELPLPLQLHG